MGPRTPANLCGGSILNRPSAAGAAPFGTRKPRLANCRRADRKALRTRSRFKRTFMTTAEFAEHEALKREWTDAFVTVNQDRPELKRFGGMIGRVVTVNFNNKALIDFADGGWY